MKTIRAADLPAYLRGGRGKGKGRSRIRVAPKPERIRGGHVFASKAEAEFYDELLLEKHHTETAYHGEFIIVLQPKFLLAGVIYSPDFLVMRTISRCGDLIVEVYEVKGKRKTDTIRQRMHRAEHLRAFRRSARQLKELHGVEVQLVER